MSAERELLQRLVECLDSALDDVAEVVGTRLEPCSPHYDDELADRRRLVQQSRAVIADAKSLLAQPERAPANGRWYDADSIDRLVRELDVAMNGSNAARQARLCDIMGQLLQCVKAQPERKPKWSDQPPTEAGWYWCEEPGTNDLFAVYVANTAYGPMIRKGYSFYELRGFSHRWAGPITPPEE